jgi:hypothetical protein
MSNQKEQREKERLVKKFAEQYDELNEWRAKHPEASFDEIVAQVTPRRRELVGELVGQLALKHGTGEVVEGKVCAGCGEQMEYKGEPKREVLHLEGETELERTYYYCDRCERGLFPPG